MGSAEGTTIEGGPGACPGKILQKYAFSDILEASFSIMLLRDSLEE